MRQLEEFFSAVFRVCGVVILVTRAIEGLCASVRVHVHQVEC